MAKKQNLYPRIHKRLNTQVSFVTEIKVKIIRDLIR